MKIWYIYSIRLRVVQQLLRPIFYAAKRKEKKRKKQKREIVWINISNGKIRKINECLYKANTNGEEEGG
jgi:hypothetical protein